MKLSEEIRQVVESAANKVLATVGSDGPNVVPLSMVVPEDEHIAICDCFMDKSVKNLQGDGRAALAFWAGFSGVQLKGRIAYEQVGQNYERYVEWLKGKHPDRTLRGVLIFTPEHVYDLAPTNAGAKLV